MSAEEIESMCRQAEVDARAMAASKWQHGEWAAGQLRMMAKTVVTLSAELAKAREVMQEIEWSSFVWNNGHAFQACPCCRSKRKVFEPFGHSPGCKLNAALAAKGPNNE